MTPQSAVLLIARLLSIGAIIDAAEILFTQQEYAADGVYSWQLMRTNNRWSTVGFPARALDQLFSRAGFATLMTLQIALAACVLAGWATPFLGIAVLTLFLLRASINVRHQYGLDGADQMNVIVWGTLVLWFAAPLPWAREAALWFIAFQSALSYLTAGVAKAVSRIWRSGEAIRGIVNTESYGSRYAVEALDRWPFLRKAVCWGTILFECGFPLALVSPRLAVAFFVMGAAFHVGIAAIMGLNNFVWPFLATYPAVFIASTDVSHAVSPWIRQALHLKG